MISGASAPIGCTISPPLATIKSTVAATLSTITYNKRPGAKAGWASENPAAAYLAGCVVKGGMAIAALPDVPAEYAFVKLRRARDIAGGISM